MGAAESAANSPLGTERKILLISFAKPFGGAEIYSGRLAELLRDRAQFFAFVGSEKVASFLEASQVSIVSSDQRSASGFWWKLSFLLRGILLLIRLRLRRRIDTVWVQGFREAFFLPVARVLGFETLVTMHVALEPSPSQVCYPFLILFADKVFCVSETVRKSLPGFVPSGKLAVIDNWTPVRKIERKPLPSNPDERIQLLYVGRLIAYKGAALLVEATRLLHNRGLANRFTVTIVGEGDVRRDLEASAAGLNILFTGFLEDPLSAYAAADVFIHPTLGPEGASLVVLEAFSFGLPCILSDIDVNRELTSEGEAALLFRSGDANDLASKIESFLEDRSLFQHYRARSEEMMRRRFHPEFARSGYLRELNL